MADLENLLLEAAGRTRTSGRNQNSFPPSMGKNEASFSDGESDSRDDYSEDEHDEYSSRKPTGSQVPFKKRLDPAELDAGQDSQEGADSDEDGTDRDRESNDESDVGDDLYKGEADRSKLAKLSELEREYILHERADKKGDKNLTEKVRSKRDNEGVTVQTRKEKEKVRLPSPIGLRSFVRSADKEVSRNDRSTELVSKRTKQQDPEAHYRLRDVPRGAPASQISSPMKPKYAPSASLSGSSQSDGNDKTGMDEEEESIGDGGMIESEEELQASEGTTFDDVKAITIRRSKLARWFMEPWFDELIVGCFVRVGIGRSRSGPIYRLCLVRNVDSADPNRSYSLENKTTFKYLNVTWGNDSSAARWQMAMVSDSVPTEEEFDQWAREVQRSNGCRPTKHQVLMKKEAIQKSNTYVYSSASVKHMIQEKKTVSSRPLNVALEKDRLRRELEIAQSKDNQAEAERLRARIQELEASRNAQVVDAKAFKLAEMNRKNRVENFRNASEAKRRSIAVNDGDAGYDPFSRRWTQSRNYYVANPLEEKDAAAMVENQASIPVASSVLPAAIAGVAATEAALEAAADAGKLVDTSAPVYHGTELHALHDFELPISLAALKKFGGPQGAVAGYMARKQRIEATIGCHVPENHGKRHVITLTLSDYQRRIGLL